MSDISAVETLRQIRAGFAALQAENAELRAANVQMAARIVELEEAQRWTPVGERLPEGDNVVLTLNQHSGFITKGYYVAGRGVYGYWWQYYPERGEMHPSYMPKSDPVTHWMPLPAAPEVTDAS